MERDGGQEMLTVMPTGKVLGATITGLDLAQPLGDTARCGIIWARYIEPWPIMAQTSIA
jgi:hypothetical protein